MDASEKTREEIETLLIKLERFEAILEAKTEDLRGEVKSITNKGKLLSLEVEELKEMRKALSPELKKTLVDAIKMIAPALAEKLAKSSEGAIETFAQNLEVLKKIQRETNNAAETIQSIAQESKKRLVLTGISLVLATGFACFVMTAGLCYFYPQTVTYAMTAKQGGQMIYGEVLDEIFDQLTPEDQDLISSTVDKRVKKPKR